MRNYLVFFAAVIFICGILLAGAGIFAGLGPVFFFSTILATTLLLILSRKKNAPFLLLTALFIFLLGTMRYESHNRQGPYDIGAYPMPSFVIVTGTIRSDPEEKASPGKEAFVFEASSIQVAGSAERASGFVLVNLSTEDVGSYKYGDILALEGSLKEPPSYGAKKKNFNYKNYLANKRIYSILKVKKGGLSKKIGEKRGIPVRVARCIYGLRRTLDVRIRDYFASPMDSVMSAIFLGKRRGVPREVTDAFARTGTIHLLAISGLHVGVIFFALKMILRVMRVKRIPATLLIIVFMGGFAILTGARASILRATTMFSILAFTDIVNRKTSVFNLIGLSGLVILFANPNQIYDVGFVLSYTAVMSIVWITPVFYRLFHADGARRALRPVMVSLAASVGLCPLIAYYFGLITPIVVVANLVAIPLLLMVMVSGIFFMSLGSLSHFFALVFSRSASVFLAALLYAVRLLKRVPFGSIEIDPPNILTILFSYLIICALVGRARRFLP